MAPALRTSLLAVMLVTALVPLAAFAYAGLSRFDAQAEAQAALAFENDALAAAVRADAAATEGTDPLAALRDAEGAGGGTGVLLLQRDGSWRHLDGRTGQAPALLALVESRVSGSERGIDPRSGAPAQIAWARAPAADAAVVLVRTPEQFAAGVGGPVDARAAFLIVLAAVMSGAVVMAVTLSARVLRPVQRLRRASQRLAEGQWEERAPVEGSRELRELALAFNQMADEIARQRRDLEDYAQQLDRLVEERTRSLLQSREDLDAMHFTVAHELREPLRSLRMLSEDLVEDADPQEAREALALVHARVVKLERLMLDLMRYDDVSRRDEALGTIDVGALLRAAAARVRGRHPEDPLEVDADLAALPEVPGYPGLMMEAFVEVLDNVVVHGPRPAEVRVRGEIQGRNLVLLFDDDGPGVPVGRREDAFLLFQRLGDRSSGTGVGLAIVRRVLERHDGDARIERAPGGGGTRVRLCLPVAGPAPRAPDRDARDPSSVSGRVF